MRAAIPTVGVVKLRAIKNALHVVYFLGLIIIGTEPAVSACREQWYNKCRALFLLFIIFNQPNQFTFRRILYSCPSVVTLRCWLFTKLSLLQKRKLCDIKLVTSYQIYSTCLYFYTPRNYSLLTPWCRVLLEKLTGLQLVKKFPAFRGTRRFITALTSVRHIPPVNVA